MDKQYAPSLNWLTLSTVTLRTGASSSGSRSHQDRRLCKNGCARDILDVKSSRCMSMDAVSSSMVLAWPALELLHGWQLSVLLPSCAGQQA